MRSTILKKFGKPLLQIGLPIAIAAFFLYKVHDYNWQILTADAAHWNYWLLAVSFLGFTLQELSFGLIWQSVLKRLGYRLNLRVCLRIYLASEFVRYIPGNVWHVLTRVLWTGKYGVPRPIAFASMTVELITKLAAGALVFALSLLFWGSANALGSLFQGSLILVLGGVSFIALLVVLHPRILNGLLNMALRILKRDPVVLTLRYSDILVVTLAWCASWFVAGCAFYIMLLALWPATPLAALPVCIGIYAIAWDFGFVTFITPSGLGFRELAIGVLFALALPFVPGDLVAVIALLSRVVSTLAELLCVSVAYLSGGKQVRAVQQEQEQKSLSEDHIEQGESNESSLNVSAKLMAERGIGGD
ncbi:MAG: YbhN family protein [Ktedonobacteraceae bacterium]|jgi:glycosyltransferase 2 family protein